MSNKKHINVVTLCSGIESQFLACRRLMEQYPDTIEFDLVAWSDIDPYAVKAHNLIFPEYSDRNFGDISTADWTTITTPIDLLTYSTPCVTADTMVLMSDGSQKKIVDIRIGDMVMTSQGEKEVVNTYDQGEKETLAATLVFPWGGVKIDATPNHLFNTANRGWCRLDELKDDDILYRWDGQNIVCEYIQTISREPLGVQHVYDIEVDEAHEFFANGIIVHNCQSISTAGRQEGLTEGSGTKSSLLWEVERAITTLRPKYLLMENVSALVSKKFMPEFAKWRSWLDEQGYYSDFQVLNSKDFGTPQNRERVFMVSIRKDPDDPCPYYEFPEPFPLEKRLKDVLEDNVDESYYLKSEQVDKIIAHCERKLAEGCGFKTNFRTEDEISGTIKTREGPREYDTYLKEPADKVEISYDTYESRPIELVYTHTSSDASNQYDAKLQGRIGDLLKSLPTIKEKDNYGLDCTIEVTTDLGWINISYRDGKATTDYTSADLAPLPIAGDFKLSGTYGQYYLYVKLSDEGNRILSDADATTRPTDSMVATPGVSVNPISHALEFDGYNSFKEVSPTLRATDYKCPHTVIEEPKIKVVGNYSPMRPEGAAIPQNTRGDVYDEEGIIGTLTATDYKEPKAILTKDNEPKAE